jgi:hypothetical protein
MSTVKISQLTQNSTTTNKANTIFVGVNLQTSVTGFYTLEQIFELSDAYAQAAFLKANTPSSVANSAGDFANGAFLAANSGATFANSAFITANASYLSQNTTASFANGAFVTANASYASQNITASFANAAFTKANSGYGQANSAASFANGAFVTANSAYDKANSNASFANGAFVTANASYESQNTTASFANGAFVTANAAYESQNTTASFANGAFVTANAAYESQNTTASFANGAFTQANTSLQNTSTIVVNTNLTVPGILTVNGPLYAANTIRTPNIFPGSQTAIDIEFSNSSMVKANIAANLVVTLSSFVPGKFIDVIVTNTSGQQRTITHGCTEINSSVGATTFNLAATRTSYLRYFSFNDDLANTFVAITHT